MPKSKNEIAIRSFIGDKICENCFIRKASEILLVTYLVFRNRATSFLKACVCSGLGLITFSVLTATGPCQ